MAWCTLSSQLLIRQLIHTSIYYYTAAAEIMIQGKDVVREGETRATFPKEPLGA